MCESCKQNIQSSIHFSRVDPSSNPNPDLANLHVAIKAIEETALLKSLCFITSAALDRQTERLGCMALHFKGMAVMVDHTTTAHGSDQRHNRTEQTVYLISKGSRRLIKKYGELCGRTNPESKRICLKASKTRISYTPSLGMSYCNMVAGEPLHHPRFQDTLALSQPTN